MEKYSNCVFNKYFLRTRLQCSRYWEYKVKKEELQKKKREKEGERMGIEAEERKEGRKEGGKEGKTGGSGSEIRQNSTQ